MKLNIKFDKFLFISVFCVMNIVSIAFAQSGRRNPADIPSGRKYVAITFDDGPNVTYTPQVLDKLKLHGANATFYVQGQKISEQTIPILQRTVAEGHDVDSHSWDHPSFGIFVGGETPIITSVDIARENLQKTSQAIFDATGYWPWSFRAPFLEWEAKIFNNGTDVLAGLDRELNIVFIDTGIDPQDFNKQNNPQAIADGILDRSDDILDGGIILLHDCGGDRPGTVASLDILLPALKARGFEVVTVRELFYMKKVTPEFFVSGMWPRVNQRAENKSDTWRRWEDYERIWPDNTNDWWLQDWWICSTPPWKRGVTCDAPIDEPIDNPIDNPIDGPIDGPIDNPIDEPTEEPTSVRNQIASNKRRGIIFSQNPSSDEVRISVADGEITRVIIYDAVNNVIFDSPKTTWDLRNAAGRKVANGTYLVVVETKAGVRGTAVVHSAKLGVK